MGAFSSMVQRDAVSLVAARPPAVAQRFSVANGAAEPRLDLQGNPSDCPFARLEAVRHPRAGYENASRLAFMVAVLVMLSAGTAGAQCLSWTELHAEDSLIELTISDPAMAGLRMWFVYVNPPALGRCTLGDERYDQVRRDLIEDPATRHVFWVGLEGDLIDLFRTERFFIIQTDRRLDIAGRVDLERATGQLQGGPRLTAEAFLIFEGLIDFAEPATIFYEGAFGNVPGEYWFLDKYVGASR